MLQNITLLNSVRNNVGLALNVAQVADHRTTLRVDAPARAEAVSVSRSGSTGSGSGRGDQTASLGKTGKRPCDEARTSDRALLRAASVDASFSRDAAPATAALVAAEALRASLEAGRLEGGRIEGGSWAAATTQAYSLRQKPQQASMPAKQADAKAPAKPASKMPAAIWASLVLSRV